MASNLPATAPTTPVNPSNTAPPPRTFNSTLTRMWHAARSPPADPTVSFAGKTVLVTGANTGLGLQASIKYAQLGCSTLILGVRSVPKGEAARSEIARLSSMPASRIHVLPLDLLSFASVPPFVASLAALTRHLDVALLNAGLGNPTFVRATESPGYEQAVQVNVLSTTYLAILLLPLLRASPSPTTHLTFTNSIAHYEVTPALLASHTGSLLRAANDEATYDPRRNYSMVKLLGMAAAQAIARGVSLSPSSFSSSGRASEVVVNTCCPALCRTDLGRNFSGAVRIPTLAFQAVFARSAEEGARTLVSATALGREGHGGFWHNDALYPLGDLAQDAAFMKQTWEEILRVLVDVQPDIVTRLEKV